MAKVYAFLADGSEEVECLAVTDVLRRAGIETVLVSAEESAEIKSSHGVRIVCDEVIGGMPEETFGAADVLFLPGGMPGTNRLMDCAPLSEALERQYASGKRIAAICAAPSILGRHGMLAGRRATCFPGFETYLTGADYTREGVVTDGTITTARGLGYALDLGLELIRLLISAEKAAEIKAAIQYDQI